VTPDDIFNQFSSEQKKEMARELLILAATGLLPGGEFRKLQRDLVGIGIPGNTTMSLAENLVNAFGLQQLTLPEVKIVKMISYDKLKMLIRQGIVEMMHCSDDGEYMRIGIKDGGATHVMGFWTQELGEDTAIVDHPTVMSKQSYDQRKLLFEE
jgi:hypothetical protein